MNIDYLQDDPDNPSWVFLNCEITQDGLIPEILFSQANTVYLETLNLYNKNKVLLCEVYYPEAIKKLFSDEVIQPALLIENTEKEKFIIKKIYI